jgi:hypothetical protein
MEPILTNLINERNQAYKSFLKRPSEENHQMLKDARKLLLRGKRRAKRQWQFTFAERCRREDFTSNPKEAWSMIFKLMEGFQGNHKTHMPRNSKTKTGKEAKGDKENAQILNEHFHSLFNSEPEVNTTVLDRLPQYEIAHELDGTPTRSEVLNAIKKMANYKAPGQSKLTTDMLKKLPPQALNFYIDIIQEFWNNKDFDLSS